MLGSRELRSSLLSTAPYASRRNSATATCQRDHDRLLTVPIMKSSDAPSARFGVMAFATSAPRSSASPLYARSWSMRAAPRPLPPLSFPTAAGGRTVRGVDSRGTSRRARRQPSSPAHRAATACGRQPHPHSAALAAAPRTRQAAALIASEVSAETAACTGFYRACLRRACAQPNASAEQLIDSWCSERSASAGNQTRHIDAPRDGS